MKRQNPKNHKYHKGLSLDYMASTYDLTTPTEKSRFRNRQIGYLNLKPGEKVLEVGCGTAALSILAKHAVGPKGEVCGIDIAPKMLEVARKKAQRFNLEIDFQEASIDKLPWPDGNFDAVVGSLMFHHLPVDVKERGLKEVHRVLKKDGRFLLSDFCTPTFLSAPLMVFIFSWIEPTRFQLLGKLPPLMKKCGYTGVDLIKSGFMIKHYLLRK